MSTVLYIASVNAHEDFVTAVRERLAQEGVSVRNAALRSGLPVRSMYSTLREGHVPSINRAAEICNALGLEFYVGPPRGDADPEALPPMGASSRGTPSLPSGESVTHERDEVTLLEDIARQSEAAQATLNEQLRRTEEVLERLRVQQAEVATDDLAGPNVVAIPVPDNLRDFPATFEVDFNVFPRHGDIRVAAGAGALVEDAPITGYIAFPRAWAARRGLIPERCSAIEVWGESMVPTIEDDALILVDHQRNNPIHNRIFVVRTEDGVIVKRLMQDDQKKKKWTLVSDNEDKSQHPTLDLPRNAKILGQVAWTGRTLL